MKFSSSSIRKAIFSSRTLRTYLLTTLVILAVTTATAAPVALAGKVYWSDANLFRIQRANLEVPLGELPSTRTDIETIVTATPSEVPLEIELDVAEGKMYWIAVYPFLPTTFKIKRANLDGTNVEDLITGLISAVDIALDLVNRKVY